MEILNNLGFNTKRAADSIMFFKESELILNDDGSIYHLNLLPEQLADTVITVEILIE